jgi:dihydropteroate synthase
MVPSVAAAVLAVQRGASVVRVHDVKETVQALKVLAAMQAAETS